MRMPSEGKYRRQLRQPARRDTVPIQGSNPTTNGFGCSLSRNLHFHGWCCAHFWVTSVVQTRPSPLPRVAELVPWQRWPLIHGDPYGSTMIHRRWPLMVKLAYAMTDPAGAGIYMLTANMTGGILMGFMAHHIYSSTMEPNYGYNSV